ncbi:hypothetical protein HHI36_001564 [Cryptolaemus montrouzieri]|uniref:Uncharacterized protein n=1 Tax=Cryptolaemus montrouzieri TaxID=559131 RepID=A0ABD2P8B2_9CUCU
MSNELESLVINADEFVDVIANTDSHSGSPSAITDNGNKQNSFFFHSASDSKTISSSDFLQSGLRKSAFQPYRQVASCTPLTNLQRGNTQALTPSILPTDINIHTLAGRGEITEDDVKNEKNINIVDKDGFSPLHWAAAFGQYNAVELLLNNGANIQQLGTNEESALHLAANGGHHEVIRLLISRGAEVNHCDHLSNTALMYAAKGNHPHSCNELLIGGADLGLSNLNDETAFMISLKNSCNLAQSVIQKYILMKFEA